jgi:hypothetical protein
MAADSVDRWPGYLKDPVVKAAVEKLGTAVGDLFTDDERNDAVTDNTRSLLRYQEYVEQTIAERVADFIGDGLDVDTFEEWIENGAINDLLAQPSGEAPDLRVVA